MLILESPTKMRLQGYEGRKKELIKLLTYTDEKIVFELKRLKNNTWLQAQLTPEEYSAQIQELEEQRTKCILFEDEQGLWTYSGLRPLFEKEYGDTCIKKYSLPESKLIPWDHQPKYKNRYYQDESEIELDKVAEFGPAGVEIGTGLGKSTIIRNLIKRYGLKAVVMAPNVNIARQLHKDLTYHFGRGKVGLYGDGKKEFNKLITVGIAASLTRIEEGSEAWDSLSKAQLFLNDESHLSPATTLAKVCFGLMANTPYRFFFSGTQMRNDGLDLLLDAITGPIVYRLTVQEGVDQGFLAKPIFKMCWTDSEIKDRNGNLYYNSDVNKMTKKHIYENKKIHKEIAELANKFISVMSRPVIILIDEIEQFSLLLPYLRFETKFAHGPLTDKNKKTVPEEYRKSDPEKLVEQYNNREFPILIGTSCIGIGTDIKPVRAQFNLRGGTSEPEVSQNVGRGTRLDDGKEDFYYMDVGVKNVECLNRHAQIRIKILRGIYPNLKEVNL